MTNNQYYSSTVLASYYPPEDLKRGKLVIQVIKCICSNDNCEVVLLSVEA